MTETGAPRSRVRQARLVAVPEGGKIRSWSQRHSTKHLAGLSVPLFQEGKIGSDGRVRIRQVIHDDKEAIGVSPWLPDDSL
jgi:hypothetical protein